MANRSRGRRIGRKVTLLILIFIIIGSGFTWWSWPDRVVNRAATALGQSDSQSFDVIVTITDSTAITELLGEPAQVKIELQGDYDKSMPQSRLQADITITAQTDSLTILIAGEVRFIDDRAYLLVAKTPSVFPLLAATKGQWIQLPRGEQIAREKMATDDQLFTDVSRSDKITILGKKVRSYEAIATSQAILSFIDGLAEALGSRLTNEQIVSYRTNISQLEGLPVILAITPWSQQVRYLGAAINLPELNTIGLDMIFTNQNQLVNISAPANALTLEELSKQAGTPTPTAP